MSAPCSTDKRSVEIAFTVQGVDFEWDSEKAQGNLRKHGVRFEEAAEAFFDPFYQSGDASRNDEKREWIIGYSRLSRLLFVVYVERVDTEIGRTRIVSARLATNAEKKLYERS